MSNHHPVVTTQIIGNGAPFPEFATCTHKHDLCYNAPVFRSLHRNTTISRRVPGHTTSRLFRNEGQSLRRRHAVRRWDYDPRLITRGVSSGDDPAPGPASHWPKHMQLATACPDKAPVEISILGGAFMHVQPNTVLTVAEFCDKYRIDRATYYRNAKLGRMPATINVGGSKRILVADEQAWLSQQRQEVC